MNRKRDIVGIADLYMESMVTEDLESEKGVDGGTPAPNTGPEVADNVELQNADSKDKKEDDHFNTKKLSDPVKKESQQNINNHSMSNKSNNKSEFDRLYEFAMEGEGDLNDLEMDAMGGDDLELGDGLGDDLGGDGDVRSQLIELRDKLDAVIDSLGGEDELGDEEGGMEDGLDELEGENTYPEKVVSEPEPKVLGGHGDRQHGDAGKGPWTGGSGAFDGKGGNAETGKVDEDPEPKVLGGHGDRQHKDAGNTSSGSNKVKHPKKGNPGAHMHGS